MLSVRPTVAADLPAVREIYEKGIAHMREEGNSVQWQGIDDPGNKIPADIEKGISFVVVNENERVCGVFAFILGEDPTYAYIENGAWPDSEPYGTIHRIASDQETRGILAAAVAYCESKTDRLRMDTHENNKTMRAAAEKNGFYPVGTIYVEDGTPRIAFCRTRTFA